MVTTRLLPLLGGIAMLAAAPAFAQSEAKPADMGAGGAANAPVMHQGTPAPAAESQPRHHMMTQHAMRSGKSDTSQDSAVDQLNNQSLQAAQQGQPFTAPSGKM